MSHPGPPLEQLLRRIIDTPQDFLAAPASGNNGGIHVGAVAGDLAAMFADGQPPRDGVVALLARINSARDQNYSALALLVCWLYADPWLLQQRIAPPVVLQAVHQVATQLALHASVASCHSDPERREELVRTALSHLGYRPAAESAEQALDRLSNVSGAERRRVVNAARTAEQRARAAREALRRAEEIRAALARKAAEESADKWSRD